MKSLNGPASQFLALGEKFIEQPFRGPETFARQDDRFGLAHRVRDQTFGVQPVERIPVKAFPSSRPIVQGQIQEREDGLIDFRGIDLHGLSPSSSGSTSVAS
jgi:hypothetical protein